MDSRYYEKVDANLAEQHKEFRGQTLPPFMAEKTLLEIAAESPIAHKLWQNSEEPMAAK